MARNLSRSTKMIVSTVVTGNDNTNTYEIPPLDGYSFSQDVATQEITLNEAGATPIRGQKVYNTGLNPVDVSFTTYIRPYKNTNHNAVERLLWGALVATNAESATAIVKTATEMTINFDESNVSQLDKLYLWFILDDVAYRINNFVVNSAELDFSIDGIAQINWSGFGDSITEDYNAKDNWVAGTDYLAATSLDGSGKIGEFIRNKLSTLTIVDNNTSGTAAVTDGVASSAGTTNRPTVVCDTVSTISSDGQYVGGFLRFDDATTTTALQGKSYTIVKTVDATDTITLLGPLAGTPVATDTFAIYANPEDHKGVTYTIAITGGSLTIDNGITFLTPEELGVVNQPLDHFTGSRNITGTITAYLNTGHMNTAGLLNTLANDLASISNSYNITLNIGGGSAPNVSLNLATAQLSIPTTATEDVISTEIGFAGLGSTGLEATDELTVVYKSSQA